LIKNLEIVLISLKFEGKKLGIVSINLKFEGKSLKLYLLT